MNVLNRRELLAAFLAAPLAGCGPIAISETAPIAGQLVGANHGLGHHLRDLREIPVVSQDRWLDVEAIVVGAGIAGLTAARRLYRSGVQRLAILELERQPGGTSRAGSDYPWGAHYLPAPLPHQRELIALLDEMQLLEGFDESGAPLVGEQFLCRDPHERLFYRGRWTEGLYLYDGASAEDLAQLARFQALVDRWVDWRDPQGKRAFAIPLEQCSRDEEAVRLDRISMADWLAANRLDTPRLLWLVDYSCRDDYGLTAMETSAWAGLFYFCSRVPSAGSESQPFITWPEGNGRLVRELMSDLGDCLHTSRVAVDIQPSAEPGAGADSLAKVIALDDDRQAWGYRAPHVVFAAPRFVSRHVIRPWRRDPPPHIAAFEYGSWIVANIVLRDRPVSNGFPLCWDNVLYDSPSLGYVVSTHQTEKHYGPTVFTYYYPLCGDSPRDARQRLLGTGQPEWAEIAVSDLSRAHPGFRELVEKVDVMRWGHAMIRPQPGFIQGQSRQAAQAPYRNIHFAHSDMSGLPLFEEAFYHGNRAAREILDQRNGAR